MVGGPVPKVKEGHLVARVSFAPKANVGPCECSCGWAGSSEDFQAHRRESGAKAWGGNASQNELSYDRAEYGKVTPASSDARAFT